MAARPTSAYHWRLHRNVLIYMAILVSLMGAMAWAERWGLSRNLIGPIFLFSTVMIYALIGISSRTTDEDEYYVAGRRIPAMYNGMATAADWMSAASFISLAGALYLQGFSGSGQQPGGLAYVMGWTGGFCLVALLIAPQLRAMKLYTLPDYFDQRYGGRWPRIIAALASVLCSFTYVVAQIYGIGLIASRLTGVQFEIGILLGLGGVLLCSFLGGMRAITWTQVAQYIMLLLAFMIPVSWLAYKQLGTPLAPLAYGQQLAQIEAIEQKLINDPAEIEVRQAFARRAQIFEDRLKMSKVQWNHCVMNWKKKSVCSRRNRLITPPLHKLGVSFWRCLAMPLRLASSGRVPCTTTGSAPSLWVVCPRTHRPLQAILKVARKRSSCLASPG